MNLSRNLCSKYSRTLFPKIPRSANRSMHPLFVENYFRIRSLAPTSMVINVWVDDLRVSINGDLTSSISVSRTHWNPL